MRHGANERRDILARREPPDVERVRLAYSNRAKHRLDVGRVEVLARLKHVIHRVRHDVNVLRVRETEAGHARLLALRDRADAFGP